jgi:hypothetical protein
MAAIGLAVLGLIAGILFQLRGLLWIVPLLFIASIGFVITREYGFLKTVFTVFAAQTVFQASYFVGLVSLAVFDRLFSRGASAETDRRWRSSLSSCASHGLWHFRIELAVRCICSLETLRRISIRAATVKS